MTNLPVKTNPEGRPVYPFQHLNAYIQLLIVDRLAKKKNISPEVKTELVALILNPSVLAQSRQALEEFINTAHLDIQMPAEQPKEVPTDITPAKPHETETQAAESPTVAAPNPRIELMKKLMAQHQ